MIGVSYSTKGEVEEEGIRSGVKQTMEAVSGTAFLQTFLDM